MKPVVAILPLYDIERNSYWMIPGYMDGVLEAGGIPAMLPLTTDEAMLAQIADTYDGFLFPGGQDVSPDFYGQEASPLCEEFVRPLDVMSKLLFNAVIKTDKPIFGICRGCQLINITLGGDVYQDLPSQDPQCTILHTQKADGHYPTHHVSLVPGSALHDVFGDTAYVNSRHHQGIRKVAQGLYVTAKAPDGVVEGIETKDRQIVAVQWHPENMWREHEEMYRLFEDFVQRVAGKR